MELDHTIVGGNFHDYDEPTIDGHNFGYLSDSPDLGTDALPKSSGVDPLDPHPLNPGDGGYHIYTFEANYALIGYPGAHVFYNVVAINGNFIVGDPNLGPLTNNGGPTLTHLPQLGSVAIDAGDMGAMAGSGTVPVYDQRGIGFGRIVDIAGNPGGPIDIGAVEVQGSDPDCSLIGDYNQDEIVNAADYTIWRNHLNAMFPLLNEDPGATPGTVTIEDFAVWKSHFGESCDVMGAGQMAPEEETAGPITTESESTAFVALRFIEETVGNTGTMKSRIHHRLRLASESRRPSHDIALLNWLASAWNDDGECDEALIATSHPKESDEARVNSFEFALQKLFGSTSNLH